MLQVNSGNSTMAAQEFGKQVTEQFYRDIHQTENDNYDWYRYSFDGQNRSRIFDLSKHASYSRFFFSNIETFHSVYSLLADEYSKRTFINVIRYRLAGHLHVRIGGGSWTEEQRLLQSLASLRTRPSDLQITGQFGPVLHYDGLSLGERALLLDCIPLNIVYTFFKEQYTYRGNGSLRVKHGDFVIDGGACFGDTAVAFALATGDEGKVFSFDPLPVHQRAITHNAVQNGLERVIEAIPSAIADHTNVELATLQRDILPWTSAANQYNPGFRLSNCPDALPTATIDDFVEYRRLPKIDFIKMDIEGSELSALHGAVNTITRFRPTLAISLYHKPEDFLSIPLFLSQTCPHYRFFLDHYTIHEEETVLFAVPEESPAP